MEAGMLLDLIDTGANASPTQRALLLAGALLPAAAEQPLGAVNAALLALRQQVLGGALACQVACPACGETLEFALDSAELAHTPPPETAPFWLEQGELHIQARLPTLADMLAVQAAASAEQARGALAARCVLQASVQGDPLDTSALAEPALQVLAAAVRTRDPLAELLLDMECPGCGHGWQAPLDLAAFVWREFEQHAGRLLADVAVLAAAFGWSEREILALHPRRRRQYLELIGM